MKKISIGFQASMPLSLRVSQEQLDALLGAIGSEGFHDIEADDASVRIRLEQVLYVRTDKDDQRVGFGLS